MGGDPQWHCDTLNICMYSPCVSAPLSGRRGASPPPQPCSLASTPSTVPFELKIRDHDDKNASIET